ncbi:hypothetical protein STEG23_024918 [Scotinomys teguina]
MDGSDLQDYCITSNWSVKRKLSKWDGSDLQDYCITTATCPAAYLVIPTSPLHGGLVSLPVCNLALHSSFSSHCLAFLVIVK